jgi:hypothetical protein
MVGAHTPQETAAAPVEKEMRARAAAVMKREGIGKIAMKESNEAPGFILRA